MEAERKRQKRMEVEGARMILRGLGKIMLFVIACMLLFAACGLAVSSRVPAGDAEPSGCRKPTGVVGVFLPSREFPNVARLARDAIDAGYPRTMILRREGAAQRRSDLLGSYPPRMSVTAVEYPPRWGRRTVRARVRWVPNAEADGAHAAILGQLNQWCDRDTRGDRTRFRLEFG